MIQMEFLIPDLNEDGLSLAEVKLSRLLCDRTCCQEEMVRPCLITGTTDTVMK